MFDKELYFEEMSGMLERAINRIIQETPDFKIFTASIWTNPNAAASSINFDNEENSLKNIRESNEYNKMYYEYYTQQGDLEQAELFKQSEENRACNPADFKLRDFEEVTHSSFSEDWESDTNGKCWELLGPALIEFGEIAFKRISQLNTEGNFELAVNSELDWYDKTWQ